MTGAKKRKDALIVFAKAPKEGLCKSRLIPWLGKKGATKIYKKVLEETLHNLSKLKEKEIFIFYTPRGHRSYFSQYARRVFLQRGRGLGQRMFNAFKRVFSMGYERVVLVGSDIPGLTEEITEEAFRVLAEKDLVFGPSEDGGFYLVGMRSPVEGLFEGVPWSSPVTLEVTLKRAKEGGLSVGFSSTLSDLDTIGDYLRLRKRGLI
ncbi:MAG: glycosyltransferase [Nitrospirae bacterium]|nr:MAG: glycosyltransferase [Nitrospirota bacterium]